MTESSPSSPRRDASDEATHRAGAFDIRTFIALLIGVYGVVLVLTGIFGTSEEELARAGGVNVNLWAGLGMVVFAACFAAWARLRPVVVPDHQEEGGHSTG
jgi:hypothetical protein